MQKTKELKLHKFVDFLLERNQQINLTSAKTAEEIWQRHIDESLLLTTYIEKSGDRIVDIGSGGGFPAIPLAILFPKKLFTLIESVSKKANFLKDCSEHLGLKNITVINDRVENVGQNKKYREKFDIGTARSVAHLNILVEYLLPLIKVGGHAVLPKISHEGEVKDAENAIKILGGKISKIESNILPTEKELNIILIEKIEATLSNYPRHDGMPARNPL